MQEVRGQRQSLRCRTGEKVREVDKSNGVCLHVSRGFEAGWSSTREISSRNTSIAWPILYSRSLLTRNLLLACYGMAFGEGGGGGVRSSHPTCSRRYKRVDQIRSEEIRSILTDVKRITEPGI